MLDRVAHSTNGHCVFKLLKNTFISKGYIWLFCSSQNLTMCLVKFASQKSSACSAFPQNVQLLLRPHHSRPAIESHLTVLFPKKFSRCFVKSSNLILWIIKYNQLATNENTEHRYNKH